jgi:hypothetical protein
MSPRETMLDAMVACLAQIAIADGYNTDAGALATKELGQVDPEAAASLTVTVLRQAKATDAAVLRTHRLTELGVAIKVPAPYEQEQAWLDKAIADVERAMDPAGNRFRFPNRYRFPDYQEMRPLIPEKDGAGWIGALLVYQTHIPIH